MMRTPEEISAALARILPRVEKPGRYTGGELNQVVKDWASTPVRTALVFPDLYDLGMSNLGLAVLYEIVNRRPEALAERAYTPWADMEREMRQAGVPLYSLETHHALGDFDLIGFSIPYESLYTNLLNALDLAGLPLRAAERDERHPLVIAGGHAAMNPEPLADFVDAFVIGEGEEVIEEIVEAVGAAKREELSRLALLERLVRLPGVYVPRFYAPRYNEDGTVREVERTHEAAPQHILKRIVGALPPAPTRLIVPYIDTVHNRFPVEIMRGCTRGCRFCQAGMITRPVRERSVAEILAAIDEGLRHTGYEEVALLSLSSSDYRHIRELVTAVAERYAGRHLRISLPSLRIESVSVDLMEALRGNRSSGFTLAPEAATERMRTIINKAISDEQLLAVTREIFRRGWPTVKLYFMIGHPQEGLEDVRAIAELCKRVLREGRQVLGGRAEVHAGVSTFVPKPHTPFQWVPLDSVESIRAKQRLLMDEMRGRGLKLNWNSPEATQMEAWLSRGDRRMGGVIEAAWRRGARYDAWQDQFKFEAWMEAFRDCGLDPEFYLHRERPIDERLPWEHIDSGLRKRFLTEDYLWSLEGRPRIDCRTRCYACGIMPAYSKLRGEQPREAWFCPVAKKHVPKEHLTTETTEITEKSY